MQPIKIFLLKLVSIFLFSSNYCQAQSSPTLCAVVNTPQFRNILNFKYSTDFCGWPPRPCARFTYNIPKYFIEVVERSGDSYFNYLPTAQVQINTLAPEPPYVAYNDNASYSFHAHTIRVPFALPLLAGLPCGGTLPDILCFSSMSEHAGLQWRTGKSDLNQPAYLAWSLSPKACLLKGAATSATGNIQTSIGADIQGCSLPLVLPLYPPSSYPVCTGWGIHFPRTGTVSSSDSTTASLMVASRIKSLASEVFQGLNVINGTWQMIYPTPSFGFREGENTALVRVKSVSDIGRLAGRLSKYLYAIWDTVSCKADLPAIVTSEAWLLALETACKGQL